MRHSRKIRTARREKLARRWPETRNAPTRDRRGVIAGDSKTGLFLNADAPLLTGLRRPRVLTHPE